MDDINNIKKDLSLQRTESMSTIASLAAYGDSEGSADEEAIPEVAAATEALSRVSKSSPKSLGTSANISPISPDGEEGTDSTKEFSVNSLSSLDRKPETPPAAEVQQHKYVPKMRSGLVSYSLEGRGEGEEGSDSGGSDDYDDDDCPIPLSHVSAPHRSDTSSPGDVDFSSSLSRAVRHTPLADVRLPASPEGRCSKILEEKIAELHRKKSRDASAADLNRLIQQRKDIRNPSIYEKLIDFCKIDEYGSNFPPDVYDPRGWPDAAYYEELAREQKAEMDRRERERRNDRTKVEFVTGVKKAAAPGELTGDDPLKKRKSKWDQTAAQTLPGVAVTTTASAVHKTLIPGVGLLSKKK